MRKIIFLRPISVRCTEQRRGLPPPVTRERPMMCMWHVTGFPRVRPHPSSERVLTGPGFSAPEATQPWVGDLSGCSAPNSGGRAGDPHAGMLTLCAPDCSQGPGAAQMQLQGVSVDTVIGLTWPNLCWVVTAFPTEPRSLGVTDHSMLEQWALTGIKCVQLSYQ